VANPQPSQKYSFLQSLKARLGYIWRGIWSTAVGSGIGIPVFLMVQADKLLGRSNVLRIGLFILSLPLLLSSVVAGTIVGSIIGIGVGIFQAVTRHPRVFVTSHDLKSQCDKISRDSRISHNLIQMVIKEHEAKKGFHSIQSKALLKELKTDHSNEWKMKKIETYLFAYDELPTRVSKILSPASNFLPNPDSLPPDNKGKGLYNILCDKMMSYEDYPKREIRKNTRMFAFLQRKGTPGLSAMPKDVVLMMAAMTNPAEDLDGNPIPAASRLTQQQAMDIATETYNDSRQPRL